MTGLFLIFLIATTFAAPDPTKKCNSLANTGTDLCTAYPCTSNSTLPPENERVLPNFPSRFACHVSGLLVFPFTPPPVVDFCQEGTFYYDAKSGFSDAALKFVNNLQPADGFLKPNVTLPFIHTGDRMYSTLGVCFCTNIGIGILKNDAFTTNGMADYLGREIKYIEYGVGDRLTDHWLKGPHHIWMDVETKLPVRAWQPTNGLQVYTKWQNNFNESELTIPEYCLKVNCSDSPPPPPGTEHSLQPMAQVQRIAPLTQDYIRASNPVPRKEFRGSNFMEMNYKLNQHIVRTPGIRTKACDQFTNQELVDLSRLLHKMSTSSFQQLYSGIRDRRMLRFNSFDEQEKHWEMEINAVKKFGQDSNLMMNVSRDGKCHETVMWFTHHLTSNAREEVMRKTLIPLLPTLRHDKDWINSYKDPMEKEYAEMIDKEYQAQLACTACHFH